MDVTKKSRSNQYIIKVEDTKVALVPLPPNRKAQSEKPNLLIQPIKPFNKELDLQSEGLALLVKETTPTKTAYIPKFVQKMLSMFPFVAGKSPK